MKITKIFPQNNQHSRHKIILKTSAGIVAGVLSFGCVDANAERLVNIAGNVGICTRGTYSDETIKMSVANTAGIKIGDGGTITLSRGSIKNNAVSGAGSKDQFGVHVSGSSRVELDEVEVALDPKTGTGVAITASDMTGMFVESGGSLSLKNSTLTVGGNAKGNNNRGIAVSGDHSQVSLDNSSVQTNSWGAVGISATQGGKIDLSKNTKIETVGARSATTGGSHGVYLSGENSALNSDNATIRTTGASAYGIKAENGGKIVLKETAIETTGGYGHALLLDGETTDGKISGGSILTSGKGAVGIWARNGASVSLQDGTTISTSGAGLSSTSPLDNEKTLSLSHGLLASDNATSIRGKNLHLTTSALSASAARAENSAQIDLQYSQIDSTGGAASTASTAALHALSGAAITGNHLMINVSGNYQGAVRAEGTDSSLSFDNSRLSVSGAGSAEALSTAARAIAGASLTINHSKISASGMQSHGVSVEGPGSNAQLDNVEIETRGARSSGVNIINGATAKILSSQIKTTAPDNAVGPWGPGILLQGTDSSLSLTGSNVTTTQKSSLGISATNGSHLLVNTSDITTSGNYSTGIAAANSTASITNSHIKTSGDDNAMGIVADVGATVTVMEGSVTTTGNGSPVQSNLTFPHALASRNEGSLLKVEGTTLLTEGNQAYGAAADDGGNIILKNLSVKTLGDHSTGLYAGIGAAKPGSVSLSATNVSVETFGDNATGAFVGRKYKTETAEMALDSVTLTTHGDNSRGLWAEAGAELMVEDSAIKTDGAQSHGILASNGGQVQANNVVASTHGDNAAALAVQGTAAFTGQANLNNSILSSEHGHGIETTGFADVELQNSRVSGEKQWLQVQNGPGASQGNASVNVSASIVSGAALTEANAYSEVSLSKTSLWFLTGNSVLSQLTNNQSLINFSAPESNQYKTLKVNNYHGDNATIALNTHLHADNSPTDQLVIDGGHADGSTSLKITNTDGQGALTQGNGIKVVDAISGATTETEAFNLLNKVKAGPYVYSLYRSSLDNSNEEAWYLRSHKVVAPEIDDKELTPPPEPQPGVPPVDEPPVVNEGDNAPPATPIPSQQPVAVPDYRAETSLYQDIPQLALLYSRMLVDSLHERTGEQFASPEKITAATQSPHMSWGRVIVKNGKSDFDGPQSRFSLNAIQLGIDLYRESQDDGSSSFAGVLGNIGKINSKVTHTDGENAGRNTVKSWGLGGYWTHFTPAGSYLDAVAQYNQLYVESSPTDLSPMKTKGYGLSASLEAGYPWQPDTDVQRFIEPQAQLIYSTVKLDNTHDEASTVKFSNADSLTGRLSLRIHQTWNHDDENKVKEERTRTTAWLRPGILHEFRGDSKTAFSSQQGDIPFVTNSAGTWGQLNAGIDHQINKSVSIAGSLSVEKSFVGDSINYGGIVGLKIKF
ncbi:autotransporter outer membrane beta-barrel domain-containing protein [Buttiauxella sp. A111]|uniref:autotransporter outer membrane beta-barrel domain-containing protein n=1 Tax=Buttiauxella sp. A111 TaxID=2563088 RepID=UPI0010ED9F2F|nr:autotransporter outer membrane beta-barrel domain-containing protein [Buttiauxella sp. A111]GDX07585.1 autotransporter outer membrane beta-barrel domain-containing protein [Buttiauxella sp. A111]